MQRPQTLSALADLSWRTTFEGARPTVPPPLIHKFIDCTDGDDAGTGTFASPWKTPYTKTMGAKPSEAWHFRGVGVPDDASILPLQDGTDHDWITFTDWDGAPLLLPGPTGPQPVVTLDGRKRICVEKLTIDASNSTTMDGAAIRGNGNGLAHIVVRRNQVKVHAGGYGVQFFIDPSNVWVEDNDLEAGDDVAYANSGDGISFGGVGVANYCWAYRNRIRNFGHMGIQSLTQVADKHNREIYSGFNLVSSKLAGGIAYLRTDDSMVVGNLMPEIASNDASQSNSKEGLIINGYRNRYYLNRIRGVHGPGILLLMNSFGGIGQSCVDNDIAFNAIYGGQTYPLAVTLRSAVPDLGGLLTMAGNRYRKNMHLSNMKNGTGGLYEGKIWQIWVTMGAAGYSIPPEEQERWCPGGLSCEGARRLAGISLLENVWDPRAPLPTGFLIFNASDGEVANVNTFYPTARDAEAAFGEACLRNVDGEEGFEESDPTTERWPPTTPTLLSL